MTHPLIIDNFAGGGGASTGLEDAFGRSVDVAVNHDEAAIAVHAANHPTTRHLCQSIMSIDPLEATGGAPVLLVWFSPDCKHHSKAKGGKPRDKNIRDLAWVVPHWLERLHKATPGGRGAPQVIMLENVEEFRQWGPIDDEGKPIRERRGEEFDLWVRRIKRQGYKAEWRELRACDYGAPTSRKRLFLIARRDGKPIVWPAPTHGKPGSSEVLSGARLPWRTAAECIDWTIPCPSIFDRKRPLKPATCKRIAAGVMRYVVNSARPFIVPVTHAGGDARAYDPDAPLPTVTSAHRGEMAAVAPVITPFYGQKADGSVRACNPVDEPMRTAGCEPTFGLVQAALAPVFARTAHGEVDRNGKRRGRGDHPVDEPFPTVTASQDSALIGATLVNVANSKTTGRGPNAWDVVEPVRTITSANGFAAVGATLVGVGGRRGQSAPVGVDVSHPTITAKADGGLVAASLLKLRNNSHGEDATAPLGTVSAEGQHHGVIAATMVQTGYGERDGQAPRALDIDAPLGTIVAGGSKHAAVAAFMHKYRPHSAGAPLDGPAPTITANSFVKRGGGAAPLAINTVTAAHMEQANTGLVGHDMRVPLSTIVGKGCTQRIVETTLIDADALPPEMMERAVQVAAFLIKYYGNEDDGHGLAAPLGTVTTRDRFAVVTVTLAGSEGDATTFVLVDIGMRMLEPPELARAQGFPEGYKLDPVCWYVTDTGNRKFGPLPKSQQIAKIGNSVCPVMAEALARANLPEHCTGGEREAVAA